MFEPEAKVLLEPFFLEIAAFFAVIVTWFAILFTGRYQCQCVERTVPKSSWRPSARRVSIFQNQTSWLA